MPSTHAWLPNAPLPGDIYYSDIESLPHIPPRLMEFYQHPTTQEIIDATNASVRIASDLTELQRLLDYLELAEENVRSIQLAYTQAQMEHDSVTIPIRRLPDELLVKIFEICLLEGHSRCPAYVCKHWKRLAYAMPCFWSAFKCSIYEEENEEDMTWVDSLECFDVWMEGCRAFNNYARPGNIDIQWEFEYESRHILRHWALPQIFGEDGIDTVATTFSHVKSVSLCRAHGKIYRNKALVLPAEAFPNLQSLKIESPQWINVTASRKLLGGLHEAYFQTYRPSEIRPFLQYSANIRTLSLLECDRHTDPDWPDDSGVLVMPHLEHLTVAEHESHILLDHILSKSLSKLVLRTKRVWNPTMWDESTARAVLNLLRRSNSNLIYLSVDAQIVGPDLFQSLRADLPHLQSLCFSLEYAYGRPRDGCRPLSEYSLQWGTGSHQNLLPELKEIVLGLQASELDTALDIAWSRRGALKSAKFILKECARDSDEFRTVRARLRDEIQQPSWQQTGMRLDCDIQP